MPISVRVLADSRSSSGARLTTMEWTYPRCIHSEIMTHGILAKNSASSRAIPVEKMLKRIEDDPFIPEVWGLNEKGMQAYSELPAEQRDTAVSLWTEARDNAVASARYLHGLNLHKQVVNRLVEPWMWITIIVSGTHWSNFFGLRDHHAAEPHFQRLARDARTAMDASTPKLLTAGDWHLPLINDDDWAEAYDRVGRAGYREVVDRAAVVEMLRKVSVGRCARVSYLTHDGKRDLDADIELHDRLVAGDPLHASPAEHVAQSLAWPSWYGRQDSHDNNVMMLQSNVVGARNKRRETGLPPTFNEMLDEACLGELSSGKFVGWRQYRKTLAREHIGGLMP